MSIQPNKMKKLISYLEEFLEYNSSNIDYNQIAQNVLELSNAKYVMFNRYEPYSRGYKTVGYYLRNHKKSTFEKIIGFPLIGKKWDHVDEEYLDITKNVFTELPDIQTLGEKHLSKSILIIIEKVLNTGKVYIVKISKEEKILGTFVLVMHQNDELSEPEILEVYSKQTGLLLERIESDEHLTESEKKFKSYTENAPFGLFVVDLKEMKFVDANPEASKITGYSYEELLDAGPPMLFDERDNKRVQEQMKEIMKNGQSAYEFTLICSDKTRIDVFVNGVKISDKLVMGFMMDISSRKKQENETKENNKMMQTLLDHTPQGFVLISKDFKVIEFNNKSKVISQMIFGKTMKKGDYVGRYSKNSERGLLLELLKKAILGQMIKRNIPVIDCEGKERIFDVNITPVFDDRQNVWAVAFTGYEITELKRTESALKESEERFRLAALTTSDLIYELAIADSSITWFGDVQHFLNISESNVPSTVKGWISLIHPEDRDKLTDRTKESPEQRKPYSGEYRLVINGNKTLYIEDYSVGVYDENNELVKIVGAISDISGRKYYEQQLKYLSFYDQLTEVYNRSFFEEEMKRLAKSRQFPISIIALDVDGLKLINDTLGHFKGDEQLQNLASILRNVVRGSDIVARTGGDEFTIILPETKQAAAETIAKRIEDKVARVNSQNKDIPLSVSIGYAEATQSGDADVLQDTYKKADDYMYRSKLSKGASAKSQIISSLMATLAERDYITEGHAQRLSDHCVLIGREMGLGPQEISNLDLLAKVHDLGKVGIPDSILFKPGPLTKEEWEIMKLHPEKGYRIASSSPTLAGIADLILKHHERWDGTGYPLGIKKNEIPLEARILSLVDSYDAMTNDRPYARALSKKEAIEEIKKFSGLQFDPQVADIFLNIIEKESTD